MRELLYSWTSSEFVVLVPKRRGKGFLRQPLGHHWDKGLDRIGQAAGCDMCGLDGSLNFEVSRELYHGPDDGKLAFVARIVPMLEAHYGCTAREISSVEHWQIIDSEVATYLARTNSQR